MRDALTRADALRARSRRFGDVVSMTIERLADTLQQCERPYVALSGGKDSLVALHLVSLLRPGVIAVWSDDELEWDRQPTSIRGIARHCESPLTIIDGYTTHGGWFQPWTDAPYWRDPDPDMIRTRRPTERWACQQGHDGVITGVRAQESTARRKHAMTRGDTYENRVTGQIVIQPILDWSVNDVWGYIAMNDLPYHPVYDAMAAAGIPRTQQRIGPLPLTPRWVLQAVDPSLPARLEQRYGRRWA